MRIKRRRIVPLALIAALALSQSAAGAAVAAEIPVDVHFTGDTSVSIEYGQGWYFSLECDSMFTQIYEHGGVSAQATGAPASFNPEVYIGAGGGPFYLGTGYVSTPYDQAPLSVGTYSLVVSGTWNDGSDTYSGHTVTPATITVAKAALGMELRVVPDPTDSGSSIVTAKFTGRFVDEYQSSFFASSALSPAGVWHITITDENGEVATERSVERSAGDDILATSFYWADAEPGVEYTASADFVASGASASNFSITSAQEFAFTGSEDPRPVPSSSATGKPDAALPEPTGFGLPLWSIILTIVLIVGLGVLVTILGVRLSRRSTTTTGEGAA